MRTFPFPVDKFGNFDGFGFTILFLNYLPSGALDGATEVGPSFTPLRRGRLIIPVYVNTS